MSRNARQAGALLARPAGGGRSGSADVSLVSRDAAAEALFVLGRSTLGEAHLGRLADGGGFRLAFSRLGSGAYLATVGAGATLATEGVIYPPFILGTSHLDGADCLQ